MAKFKLTIVVLLLVTIVSCKHAYNPNQGSSSDSAAPRNTPAHVDSIIKSDTTYRAGGRDSSHNRDFKDTLKGRKY